MRVSRKAFSISVLGLAAIAVALAQSTSNSGSTSKQGGASASASSSARSSGGQSGNVSAFGSTLPKPTHAILYSAGPNWIEGRPANQQNLGEHAQYMSDLIKRGYLIFGGPWRDLPGGMTLIRARNDEEARAILDRDPAVRGGIMVGELRAWNVVFQGMPQPILPNAGNRLPGG